MCRASFHMMSKLSLAKTFCSDILRDGRNSVCWCMVIDVYLIIGSTSPGLRLFMLPGQCMPYIVITLHGGPFWLNICKLLIRWLVKRSISKSVLDFHCISEVTNRDIQLQND